MNPRARIIDTARTYGWTVDTTRGYLTCHGIRVTKDGAMLAVDCERTGRVIRALWATIHEHGAAHTRYLVINASDRDKSGTIAAILSGELDVTHPVTIEAA